MSPSTALFFSYVLNNALYAYSLSFAFELLTNESNFSLLVKVLIVFLFPRFLIKAYSKLLVILSYIFTRALGPVTSRVLIIFSSDSFNEYFATNLLCLKYSR